MDVDRHFVGGIHNIIYVGVGLDPKVVREGLAIITGGIAMILGYLIYEFYVLGFCYVAFIEVPFNIGQVTIGLALAIPAVRAVNKAYHRQNLFTQNILPKSNF